MTAHTASKRTLAFIEKACGDHLGFVAQGHGEPSSG